MGFNIICRRQVIKKFAIFLSLLVMLAACDNPNQLPIEAVCEMVVVVAADYGLELEEDSFENPESAVLAIYAPEFQASRWSGYLEQIPYTEALVEDITLLKDIYDFRFMSTDDKKISILIHDGNGGRGYNECYMVNDDDTLTLKQYDITVPLANVIDETVASEETRHIIMVPRWSTMSPAKDVINEVYEDVKYNTICVIEEALKHIDAE